MTTTNHTSPIGEEAPADLLPNALWTRNGSIDREWWSFKGYEARKDSADQWVLRKAGEELYRHAYLQVVMAHAERELLAATPTAAGQPCGEPCSHDYVRSDKVCTECGELVQTDMERKALAAQSCGEPDELSDYYEPRIAKCPLPQSYWTKEQVAAVREDADRLVAKLTPGALLDDAPAQPCGEDAAEQADEGEDDEIQPTPESERAAFNAMMRWHLIQLLQAWRYGGDLRSAGMAAFEWARTNDVGKAAFEASERAVKIAALPRAAEQADEAVTVDANRYRWLRDQNKRMHYTTDYQPEGCTDLIQIEVAVIGEPVFTPEGHFDFSMELDRAIDAARAKDSK